MDDIKLKPCPFCGGEANIEQTGRNQLTIRCKKCLIKKEQKHLRLSQQQLVEILTNDWNKREV